MEWVGVMRSGGDVWGVSGCVGVGAFLVDVE